MIQSTKPTDSPRDLMLGMVSLHGLLLNLSSINKSMATKPVKSIQGEVFLVWRLTGTGLFAPGFGDSLESCQNFAWVGYVAAHGTLGAPSLDTRGRQDALRHTVTAVYKSVDRWAGCY